MNKLEQKLSRIDLNLMVSLSVLLNERSVSKAANVLYVSQPAMSKTLQRLRGLFDDPLFYRTSSGIVPSAKASELQKILPDILAKVKTLFESGQFEPLTCNQTITISIPSVLCHSILLPFVIQLNKLAPNICIADLPTEADPFSALERGDYDFSIHISTPPNNNFSATSLGLLTPCIYARKGHPLTKIKGKIDHNLLASYKFISYQAGAQEISDFESPADRIRRLAGFDPNIIIKSIVRYSLCYSPRVHS